MEKYNIFSKEHGDKTRGMNCYVVYLSGYLDDSEMEYQSKFLFNHLIIFMKELLKYSVE